jgi:DHA1 family bicyclomycin/chloramphenicol resistance-like MFS transporter
MLAPNIETLVIARVFQAIGACAGMAVTRATLRDSYGRDGTPRVMSILSISMVLVPIFAPILGGYLQVWVGWRANFAVLAGSAAVLVVLMWWRLPETGTNLPPSGSLLRSVFANVLPLFAVPSFLGYALVVVASGGAYFAFTAVTPVILIEHFGLTPDEFGICGGLIMGGTLAGLILTNRLVTRHGIDRLIPAGIVVLAVSGVLTCALSTIHQVWAVVAPLTLMGVGIGLLAPNGHSGAIGARPELAGAASGLTVFLQMSGAGIVTAVMAAVEHRTTLPFGLLLIALALVALAGFRWAHRA